MKAKRYIYLLFALFVSATGLLASLYTEYSVGQSIIHSLIILVASFYIILSISYINYKYIKFVDKYFRWSNSPVKRLTFTFSMIILGGFGLALSATAFLRNFWSSTFQFFTLDFWCIVLGCIMALSLIYTIEEAFRFMWKVNILSLQAEKRKTKQNKVKLEALKKQINPHFLFNCFNVLAELVHIDSEKSDEFVTEMGKIYRYVLDQKKDFIVTLAEELEFIQSFIFLQKIRFDKNLIFKTNIGKTYLNHFIPPLTLELLVENAIKHNQITDKSPLIIEIGIEGDLLVVKNNYQPRRTDMPSTQIGLKNLKEQFRLISGKQPKFFIKDGSYIAEIPLIKP